MNRYTCPMFHFFYEDGSQPPIDKEYAISYDKFEDFLGIIKNNNIQTLTPEIINACDIKDQQRYTMLTFDDGHISNIKAAEILSRYGMKGVFYVVQDFASDPQYFSKEDIAYIYSLGHTIGVHGKYHNMWKNKDDKTLIEELSETKLWIESIIQHEVITCSAPRGGISAHEFNVIEKNIPQLKYIRCSFPGTNTFDASRLLSAGIRNTTTDQEFTNMVMGNSLYYMKLQTIKRTKNFLRPIYNLVTGRVAD